MLVEARGHLLHERAGDYVQVALNNISREFPIAMHYVADTPDLASHRQLHPAFYGSFDWHSCVEMHWALIRLLRTIPDLPNTHQIVAGLDRTLNPETIAGEVAFFNRPANRNFERPYGWGWLLLLADDLRYWPDPVADRWLEALQPLADLIAERFAAWLPAMTYPVRHGVHANSAFACSLALPYAEHLASLGKPALRQAIADAANRWFAADRDYPAAWEPSGTDFLSPALTEAELMIHLDPANAGEWLTNFLPGLAGGQPKKLLQPAVVADDTDGQIAHLHGLNLSRAWCFQRLLDYLPAGDPRQAHLEAATQRHLQASIGDTVGSDYAVEHWLLVYAVLLLSA